MTKLPETAVVGARVALANNPITDETIEGVITSRLEATNDLCVRWDEDGRVDVLHWDDVERFQWDVTITPPVRPYDPIDHLREWSTDALHVRAAQTRDPRVLAELARRDDQVRRDAIKKEDDDAIALLWQLADLATEAHHEKMEEEDEPGAFRLLSVRRWCAAFADYAEFVRSERITAP